MSTVDAPISPDLPSEDAPQRGTAMMFHVPLSEADYFVAEGDHVIRSREFEVIVGGESFEDALHRFNSAMLDYAIYLGSLETLVENEEEMFHLLAPRMMRITREFERHEEEQKRSRRRIFGLGISRLRNPEDGPEWRPSRHGGSSVPSLA